MPTGEIVLYQFQGSGRVPSVSPPCLKIHLALRRLGLAHRVVDLASPGEVKRYSPSRRLPAIVVGGETVTDSVSILDRLESLHPDAPLWPRDRAERTVDRLWDCFATDTLYWQGFYLRWLVPENRTKVIEATLGPGFSPRKLLLGAYARLELGRRARGQGIGGRARADVETSFAASLAMITEGLGAGPFLQGRATPGRGDLAIAAHLAQLAVTRDAATAGRLASAHARLVAHVAAAFDACGLPAP